jgi:hypothetical protein
VARRFERWPVRATAPLPELPADEENLSRRFERLWAQAIISETAQLQRCQAGELGPEAVQRVELLRLGFGENLIRMSFSAVQPADHLLGDQSGLGSCLASGSPRAPRRRPPSWYFSLTNRVTPSGQEFTCDHCRSWTGRCDSRPRRSAQENYPTNRPPRKPGS